MHLFRIAFDLISRPKNFLNAIRVVSTIVQIRRLVPNNTFVTSYSPDKISNSNDLRILLSKHGSDKSTVHNYDQFYFDFLQKIKNNSGLVVEIGIGTNNPLIPSSMGVTGTPGASLRSFRDFLPGMQIFGADIDREILFTEERIKTFYVDQKKFESFKPLLHQIKAFNPGAVDFVVIDGLHQPLTDLNSVRALLPYLKVGAKLFVEDVFPNSTNIFIWKLAEKNFNDKHYSFKIHETKSAKLIEIVRIN